MFGINLIATMPGSFIFALDLVTRTQPTLWGDYDMGEQALADMSNYITELGNEVAHSTGIPRPVLAGLKKLSECLDSDLQEIEIKYSGKSRVFSASLSTKSRERILSALGEIGLGPQTIKGRMIEINIEKRHCILTTNEGRHISCSYDPELEDQLIRSIKHNVEIAGQTEPIYRPVGGFRIIRIERFRRIKEQIEEDDDDSDN
jgi:hypothetical protein